MDHDGEPHKRFICSFPNCVARYNKQWKLDAHMCKHTGVKPFTCDRDSCGKSFCTKYHLERHELTHSGTKPFRCTEDNCTDSFTTNFNLQRHISRAHSQEQRKYACRFESCGLVFRKNKQLRSHVCEQHTELPPYQCTYEGCQMRFMVPSKLKRHEKVHRGYPCEECRDFTGKTWTELLKHRKESHRPVFKCEHCNKVFRDMWSLQKHQVVHSDVRVVLSCPRDGCQRTFTTIFNLQSHIRSFHDELRPFTCSHEGCNKTFAMKQSLQRHTVVHDPDRKKMKMARPRRSLASRLSGYKPTKKTANKMSPDSQDPPSKPKSASGGRKMSQPATVELILQDTSLRLDPHLATNISSTLNPVLPV